MYNLLMKILLIIVIVFTTFSCKLTEQTIVGQYSYRKNFEFHGSIKICPNKTFEYNVQQGLVQWHTTGLWELKDHSIILNSDTIGNPSYHSTVIPNQTDSLLIKVFLNTASMPAWRWSSVYLTSPESLSEPWSMSYSTRICIRWCSMPGAWPAEPIFTA